MSSQTHSSPFPYPPPPPPPPGARQTPPLVGLQLHATNLPSQLPNDRYHANIMHRVVPPTLQQVTVSIDASSCDLAATFSLPVAYVAAHWLTSRTPMELPGYHKALIHNYNNHYHPNPSAKVTLRRHPLSPAQLASYRDLAVALTRKLEPYVQPSPPNLNTCSRPSRARIERLRAQAAAAIPDPVTASTSTLSTTSSAQEHSIHPLPLQPTFLPHPTTRDTCGFSFSHTHPDLVFSPDRKTVTKNFKGLYRNARTSSRLNHGWNYYIEFLVCNNAGEGGICVGLSSFDTPLKTLVGTSESSIGFHSSGKAVVRKGEWIPYGTPYGQGDTIGMLVEMPPERASHVSSAESLSAPSANDNETQTNQSNKTGNKTPTCNAPRITFFINGESQGTLPLQDRTFLLEDKDSALLLHATACLYRADSSIQVKCCASDWEYFPSASAVCSGLHATCHRRNPRLTRGYSISTGAEENRKIMGARELGGCDSVLTP